MILQIETETKTDLFHESTGVFIDVTGVLPGVTGVLTDAVFPLRKCATGV